MEKDSLFEHVSFEHILNDRPGFKIMDVHRLQMQIKAVLTVYQYLHN